MCLGSSVYQSGFKKFYYWDWAWEFQNQASSKGLSTGLRVLHIGLRMLYKSSLGSRDSAKALEGDRTCMKNDGVGFVMLGSDIRAPMKTKLST